MANSKRVYFLDFLRSFAIIMVLVLHSISSFISNPQIYGQPSWYIYLVLNAFTRTGVPLFLMISGYLLLSSDKSRSLRAFYKKSLFRIVIPLLFWNVVYYLYQCGMGVHEAFNFKELYEAIFETGTEYHLWYLYTLAGIYLTVPFLKIIVDNCSVKKLSVLMLIMLLFTTIRPFINSLTPLYFELLDTLFNGYLGCFFMGYVFGKCRVHKRNVIWYILFGVACLILSCYYNNKSSSSESIKLVFNYGYSFVHYGLAVSIFTVSRFIFENRTFLSGIVEFVSKHSFGVYLIHVMVNDLIFRYIMIDAAPILSSVYIFVISFSVSLLVSFILGKIKFIRAVVS